MKNLLYALTLSILVISACSEPSSIGASILGSEEIELNFTDQIELKAKTVEGDSVRITNALTSSIGVLDEPVFGRMENQLFLTTSIGPSNPDFSDAVLDSIVLRIPLSEGDKYGDDLASHTVEVFQLDENLFEEAEALTLDSIFTTTSFSFDESNLIGQRTFVPDYENSIVLKNHLIKDSLITEDPQLRVRIDNSFGAPFFDNPENIASDSVYQDLAKGFALKSTPTTSSFIGLDFEQSASYKLLYYYTKEDTVRRIYQFNIGGFTSLNVIQDRSGSAVEQSLSDPADDQEQLYVESYAGANIEIDLEDVKQFQGKIINSAILELTVADVPGYDLDQFTLPEDITIIVINDQGNAQFISDIASLVNSNLSTLEAAFGGFEKTDGTTGHRTYEFNITNHIIDLLGGEFGDNYKIYLRNRLRGLSPRRAIFNGNGSDDPAPKLKLVVTEP